MKSLLPHRLSSSHSTSRLSLSLVLLPVSPFPPLLHPGVVRALRACGRLPLISRPRCLALIRSLLALTAPDFLCFQYTGQEDKSKFMSRFALYFSFLPYFKWGLDVPSRPFGPTRFEVDASIVSLLSQFDLNSTRLHEGVTGSNAVIVCFTSLCAGFRLFRLRFPGGSTQSRHPCIPLCTRSCTRYFPTDIGGAVRCPIIPMQLTVRTRRRIGQDRSRPRRPYGWR